MIWLDTIHVMALQMTRTEPGFSQWTCKGVNLYWRVEIGGLRANKVSGSSASHVQHQCATVHV